jgi:hypothetical protein
MAKSCSLFYSRDMNIHDVLEPRDIFQQHWEEYYSFRKKKPILIQYGCRM